MRIAVREPFKNIWSIFLPKKLVEFVKSLPLCPWKNFTPEARVRNAALNRAEDKSIRAKNGLERVKYSDIFGPLFGRKK